MVTFMCIAIFINAKYSLGALNEKSISHKHRPLLRLAPSKSYL